MCLSISSPANRPANAVGRIAFVIFLYKTSVFNIQKIVQVKYSNNQQHPSFGLAKEQNRNNSGRVESEE